MAEPADVPMPPSKRKREAPAQDIGRLYEGGPQMEVPGGNEVDKHILARRAEMLQSRQVQLEQLMTDYDDMVGMLYLSFPYLPLNILRYIQVCELFHLDKFVTMLNYDPKASFNFEVPPNIYLNNDVCDRLRRMILAKCSWRYVCSLSIVERPYLSSQFKAEFDLLNRSAEATAVQSPARKTRRAATQLRSSLAANIGNAATSSPMSSPLKGKSKLPPCAESLSAMSSKTRTDKVPSVSTVSPLNGYVKTPRPQVETPESPALTPRKVQKVPHATPTRSTRLRQVPVDQDEKVEPSQPVASSSTLPRGTKRKASHLPPLNIEQDPQPPATPLINEEESPSISVQQLQDGVIEASSPPKFKIRRVLLFQRAPPIKYTHPDQLPPPPSLNGSIHTFLKSYRSLEDGVDVTDDSLEEDALVEARTRARIRQLKKEGRLLINVEDLPDTMTGSTVAGSHHVEPKREEDAYDHIVSSMAHMTRAVGLQYTHKKNTAKKIAKAVLAWHGNREGVEEKQRKTEALRMKALAKSTAKEIEKQWRNAVNVRIYRFFILYFL